MRRVLLLDDIRIQRFVMASLLSHLNCEVHSATSGEEALAIAAEVKPDVVMLDIAMPEMDGYELAIRLRQEAGLTAAKLVAVSAWDCDVPKLAEAGIDQYIRKPINLHALKTALEH